MSADRTKREIKPTEKQKELLESAKPKPAIDIPVVSTSLTEDDFAKLMGNINTRIIKFWDSFGKCITKGEVNAAVRPNPDERGITDQIWYSLIKDGKITVKTGEGGQEKAWGYDLMWVFNETLKVKEEKAEETDKSKEKGKEKTAPPLPVVLFLQAKVLKLSKPKKETAWLDTVEFTYNSNYQIKSFGEAIKKVSDENAGKTVLGGYLVYTPAGILCIPQPDIAAKYDARYKFPGDNLINFSQFNRDATKWYHGQGDSYSLAKFNPTHFGINDAGVEAMKLQKSDPKAKVSTLPPATAAEEEETIDADVKGEEGEETAEEGEDGKALTTSSGTEHGSEKSVSEKKEEGEKTSSAPSEKKEGEKEQPNRKRTLSVSSTGSGKKQKGSSMTAQPDTFPANILKPLEFKTVTEEKFVQGISKSPVPEFIKAMLAVKRTPDERGLSDQLVVSLYDGGVPIKFIPASQNFEGAWAYDYLWSYSTGDGANKKNVILLLQAKTVKKGTIDFKFGKIIPFQQLDRLGSTVDKVKATLKAERKDEKHIVVAGYLIYSEDGVYLIPFHDLDTKRKEIDKEDLENPAKSRKIADYFIGEFGKKNYGPDYFWKYVDAQKPE